MTHPLIEVCVDNAEGLAAAVAGGADRIELCAALSVGGLTPSPGLMALAARATVPVLAMIRPREGDFVYSSAEISQMVADIVAVRHAGLAGVVFGANRADATLDVAVLRELIAASKGLDMTLHRAFDLAPDPDAALETAISLGIPRVLTSGGARTAVAGRANLERLFKLAGSRVTIMPGSGITAETVSELRGLPLREVHASCAAERGVLPAMVAFGFAGATTRQTDPDRVRALRQALSD